jgi:hypothetical protein
MKASVEVGGSGPKLSPEQRLALHMEAMAYLLLGTVPGLTPWAHKLGGVAAGVGGWLVFIAIAYIIRKLAKKHEIEVNHE